VPLIQRHFHAAWYVLTVVLPVILRTGKRPVIFSRFAGMGDILCTFPAALELKKRHPGATFIYNCAASFACLPAMGGVTERVTHLRHMGPVGHWYGRLLAGYYNFGSDDDEFTADHSELFLLGYARRQGVTVAAAHPRLTVEPAVVGKVKSLLQALGLKNGPLILIHPGPTWPVKQWPQESWAGLVQEFQRRGFGNIIQLGTGVGGYSNLGARDTTIVPGAISLVDKLSLAESVALISLADLLVGIDSGLLHAAVCFGVPAVGVWGATSPKFLFAESESRAFVVSDVKCQGCHHRVPRLHHMTGCPHDIRCMSSLGVEKVLAACVQILEPAKFPAKTGGAKS
jgi:ADP-heptose:LPS heptosyltransferase